MPQDDAPDDQHQDLDRSVGRRIRHFRETSGLSQAELAERISVSYQQLQKYENGRTPITLRRLRLVADSLGVGVQALLADPGEDLLEPHKPYRKRGPRLVEVNEQELQLLRMFRRIQNDKLRRSIVLQIRGTAEIDATDPTTRR